MIRQVASVLQRNVAAGESFHGQIPAIPQAVNAVHVSVRLRDIEELLRVSILPESCERDRGAGAPMGQNDTSDKAASD